MRLGWFATMGAVHVLTAVIRRHTLVSELPQKGIFN